MEKDAASTSADGDPRKGKIVLSKCAVAVWVVSTVLAIVAVGLLVGLLTGTTCEPLEDYKSATGMPTPGIHLARAPAATTPPDPSLPWNNIRLPDNLIPSHYVVDLQPNLTPIRPDYYTFNGSSSVAFMVMKSTPYIIIHSYQLEYTALTILDHNEVIQNITRSWQSVENQFLIIEMKNALSKGQNYTLYTSFNGELKEALGGLYRSTYENAQGEHIVIATSQMQPADARKAFPCFDEPALKATFDISLWHDPSKFALSNMPNISTEHMYDNWWKTTFDRTKIMSTYLLACVVCDFDYVESMTQDGVQTRIYARSQQIASRNGKYIRDITPVILDYFEDYFNVSYPLPKSDQIAVPDFAAGSMENWGLVIYRETALLFNPAINSPFDQQNVAAVATHELAHQWFGNLITPIWWDEVWLNEGFASYMEYIGTSKLHPDWGMDDQFVVEALHRAMLADGITSRPIVPNEVNTPEEIYALFDVISYLKGACIIRMINEFAGQDAFVLGLKSYLDANAYGSVRHRQLFEYWEKAINDTNPEANPPRGFTKAMDPWIMQMGYPVVNMIRNSRFTNIVSITQDRFMVDPNANKTDPPSDFNYKWNIPLWYVMQNSSSKTIRWILSDTDQDEITVPSDEYFIGNYEAFGYYRVNYDLENWNRISQQLNDDHTVIDIRSRGQLIDDAFSLASAEIIPYEIALDLIKFLRQDFEYVPWKSARDAMSYFDMVLGRSYVYGFYSEYMLYLVEPLYCNVSWTDEGGHLEKFQRASALSAACLYGYEDCVSNAAEQFSLWMEDSTSNTITPNLRTIVYCNGIRYGGAKEWDFVWEKYQEEKNSQEKEKLQNALTCTTTPWIIKRFLNQWILNTSFVRAQDTSRAFEDLCANEHARDITWDFIRANWEYIYDVYGVGFLSFGRIIGSCTSHFSSEFELQELKTFEKVIQNKRGIAGLTEEAIEVTNTNINWRKNHEDEVYIWLTQKLTDINSKRN